MTNCGYNNVYPCQPACTNSYVAPCFTSFTNNCINSCVNPYVTPCTTSFANNCVNPCSNTCSNICTNPCINYCNNCCTNHCNNCFNLPNIEIPPTSNGNIDGCKGYFCWHIEYYIDDTDITKDSFKIKLTLFGATIVDTVLDVNNPNINLDLTISGVGVKAQLGVDFTERDIYLRGKLNFYFYQKDFDIIIYKF